MTLEQIAKDIADESETAVVEECSIVILDGKNWYDVRPRRDKDPAPLKRALAYLAERGLLERPKDPTFRDRLVRIPRAAELGLSSLNLLGQ